MTIEEAIVYYEQEAEKKERMAERIGNQLVGSAVANYQNECLDCAKEYRQLIVWLMELKDLRSEQNEEKVFIDELMKENKELKRLLKMAEDCQSNYNNEYFKKINYKNSCTEDLLYEMEADERNNKWKEERHKYGGYDERVTWNLNTFMTEQIYTWLKLYFDNADGFIDLNFYKFQINNIEMSERDAILLVLEDIEFYLQHFDDWIEADISHTKEVNQECDSKIAEAYYILGVIFPTLWW